SPRRRPRRWRGRRPWIAPAECTDERGDRQGLCPAREPWDAWRAMSPGSSAGRRLRDAIAVARRAGAPLHMVGVADGSDALEAERAGFRGLYVSGSQVAAARGWADIGRLDLAHVVEHVRRILDSGTELPVLVDADTGFHDVAETVGALEAAGAAGVHVED